MGTVYKAKLASRPCVAKHFPQRPVHDNKDIENNFAHLKRVRHPNLVSYLALRSDPFTNAPVLAMELLDQNLTQFLEESTEELPLATQCSLAHDIASALAHLHSCKIIHGNLTSNNVLLSGTTAKISDFGMSKLLGTAAPRSDVNIPPGAIQEYRNLLHSETIDVYDLGVLMIQIITREKPEPTSRVNSLKERITPNHPLRTITLSCLSDDQTERPTASLVTGFLKDIKELTTEVEVMQKEVAQLKEQLRVKDQAIKNLVNKTKAQEAKIKAFMGEMGIKTETVHV